MVCYCKCTVDKNKYCIRAASLYINTAEFSVWWLL